MLDKRDIELRKEYKFRGTDKIVRRVIVHGPTSSGGGVEVEIDGVRREYKTIEEAIGEYEWTDAPLKRK